jgi:hypothetical protein
VVPWGEAASRLAARRRDRRDASASERSRYALGVRPAIVIAAGVLFVTATAAFLLIRGGEQAVIDSADEPLEPFVESPRPPVAAQPPKALLAPMPTVVKRARPAAGRAALLHERNEAAREHRRLVAAYGAGTVSIADVEAAERLLLDARHRLGEIDAPTWHRARAVLLKRTVEWTQAGFESGMVSADDVDRARLALDLERMLAGDDNNYATKRDAFFVVTKERQRSRVEAGLVSPKDATEEVARLESEFPSADVARAADR